jgi:hypothetical protein
MKMTSNILLIVLSLLGLSLPLADRTYAMAQISLQNNTKLWLNLYIDGNFGCGPVMPSGFCTSSITAGSHLLEARKGEEVVSHESGVNIGDGTSPVWTVTIAEEEKKGHRETGRDGRFIAYDDGTVLDTRTNLMWAAKDNGRNINWEDAKSYCENYRGGGYTDWRMPTQNELVGLYDTGKTRPALCDTSYSIHVATELIDITCFAPWTLETRASITAGVSFFDGRRYWYPQSLGYYRALPVRSAK